MPETPSFSQSPVTACNEAAVQDAKSPTGAISTANQVLAQSLATNLSTVSAMPIALQVPGGSAMPFAVNPQLPFTHAERNVQALPQSLQAHNPGSIIILNVGNGNNLSAALSQLGTLIQPPQGPVTIAQASSSAATAAQTVVGNSVSQTSFTPPVSTSFSGTPTTSVMDSQPNTPTTPRMFVSQSSQHQNLTIPTQLPQPQQPAAFMLVPIPQLPATQNVQTSVAHLHQGPAPVFLNVQNQVASAGPVYQSVQPQLQTIQIASHQQQQLASQLANYSAASPIQSPMPQELPKSDELRHLMMRNSANNLSALLSDAASANCVKTLPSPQPLTPQNSCAAQNAFSTLLQYPALSVPEQVSHPSAANQSVIPSTPMGTQAPMQPTVVSSPGLAFLAQVSSFTSREQTNSLAGSRTYVGISDSSAVSKDGFQDHTKHEVNNHLPVLRLDEVKEDVPVSEDSPTTPSGFRAVSSTTKIGDEELRSRVPTIIREQSVINTTDVIVQELMKEHSPQCQAGERRKKEMPFPPPVREKKKKGPAPKLNGNEVCLICGDKASGFHYNTLSCEGCKGFFRRTVIKAANYQCKLSGHCTMDLYMRRKCQKCRFEKCKAVGMREESVLSEEKVKAKKLKKECDRTPSPMRHLGDDSSIPKLTPQQRSLIELLKANERRFQWPTTEDMKKVTVWVDGDDTPHSRALRFAHFTELCILIVQLVVEFTKQLPGFLTVLREDQIVLLKACAIEVMLLRAAKQYNKHDGSINFLNGKLYDKSSFYKAGMQVEFVDPIFQFCNSMAQLGLDETEYAILVAINTFSTDRPHIKDIGKVECMQDPYVELLRVYSKIRHPDDPLMFARILMKIVELRTLNNYHSEQIFALKVQDKKLPPLLAEIWDM